MPTATAKVNGVTVAETDSWETVEGNIYFPPSSVEKSYLTPSNTHTHCGWKGTASYYNINVDGKEIRDAAWFYSEPMEKAKHIENYVAFCGCTLLVAESTKLHYGRNIGLFHYSM
ncbi:hypothetical protein H2199_006812 [Coniosporium tulheliwenetii]|uniref:Uncharacterized protein n=1 Tax=Coniosporium tulheliwenetii TaxID=3383036 RepID=A0ACC2YV25_9PEZI|nr:hypothetical protein H2199_006812 [Cladosporium sp. JES 115]